MIFICQICGASYEAKFHNSMYCKECAAFRKMKADKESWERRKQKAKSKKKQNTPDYKKQLAQLEYEYADRLGLSQDAFNEWKRNNTHKYTQWRKAQETASKLSTYHD